MAGVNLVGFWFELSKVMRGFLNRESRESVFADGAFLNTSTQHFYDELVSVTDAENRKVEVENFRIDLGGIRRVHGRGAAGYDEAFVVRKLASGSVGIE